MKGVPQMADEAYIAKLRDPRWQKVRLRIFDRDDFRCQLCGGKDRTLQVHHRYYLAWGTEPWDYPDDALVTLCDECHASESACMKPARTLLVRVVSQYLFSDDVVNLAGFLEAQFSAAAAPHEVLDALLERAGL